MAIARITDCGTDTCKTNQANAPIDGEIGRTAHTCYKTKVCKKDGDVLKDLAAAGSVWPIDYYNQQGDRDDALWNLDSYTSPLYQNYMHVSNFPFMLDGTITPTVDGETGVVTGEGSGKMLGLFNLHVGDVIIGPIGDTRYMFNVTRAVPISITGTPWYNIDFTLVGKVDNNPNYHSLIDKVAATKVFDGQYGLMDPKDAADTKDMTPLLSGAMKKFMQRVLNASGHMTLTKDGKPVYDPEIAKFTKSLISANCNTQMNAISMTKDAGSTLLDVLADRSLTQMGGICPFRCLHPIKPAGHMTTDYINLASVASYVIGDDYPMLGSDKLVERGCGDPFPPEPPDGQDPDLANCIDVDPPCCGCVDDPMNDVNTNYGRTIETDTGTIPMIKDPFVDKYYILSEDYYKGKQDTMSYLERMVYKYSRNEEVSVADLMPLWNDVKHWCSHSWFYYMPLLLLLSKYAMAKRGDCEV